MSVARNIMQTNNVKRRYLLEKFVIIRHGSFIFPMYKVIYDKWKKKSIKTFNGLTATESLYWQDIHERLFYEAII